MSISRGTDKENVVHMCNGISFSLKREGNSAECYNMINMEGIMLNEMSVTEGQMLYDSVFVSYS